MVPHLIIVGGGFGGLSAARALRGAAVRVTLIDKRNYHLFRPMLYQVATGLLSADEISGPLRSMLSRQENIDVLLDEVTGISPKQRIGSSETQRLSIGLPHSGDWHPVQLFWARRMASVCTGPRITR
jgi:NADH dehydrogenase FAD-containing subunit